MNQYRKDIEKLYQRIIKVVSRGPSFVQSYYDLIDEVIFYGQSELLQDVMILKFKIDTKTFNNVDSLKKSSFKTVSGFTISKSVSDLESLFKLKGVYALGTQFFDSLSTQYLGDVKQFDTSTISQGLNVYTFYTEYLQSAISQFISNPLTTLIYNKDSIVYYGNKLYQCGDTYTWNKENQITPTFSNYWFEVYSGTMSLTTIQEQTKTLGERYSDSIDILRKYYYIDYSRNLYLESNYIDEYFE
jgi:hypothetical protein